MPEVRTWKCAMCGKLKSEQNGWWAAGFDVDGDGIPSFVIQPYPEHATPPPLEGYCGAACALKAVSAYLDSAHREQSA